MGDNQVVSMMFSRPLIEGVLIRRYKRFLADVSLTNGTVVTAPTPNRPEATPALRRQDARSSHANPGTITRKDFQPAMATL